MKTVIVLCVFLGCATAKPIEWGEIISKLGTTTGQFVSAVRDAGAEIIQDQRVQNLGGYLYKVITNNGIYQEQTGQVVPKNATNDEHIDVKGGYGWVDKVGNFFANVYEAGLNGLSRSKYRLLGSGLTSCIPSLCGTDLG